MDVLELTSHDRESSGEDLCDEEVAVAVLAAGINPADCNIIEGRYPMLPKQLPAIGGNECVGEVVAVGRRVTGLSPGDWVVPGVAGAGGLWRSSTWRGPASAWLTLPPGVPLLTAATLTVSSCTAFRMLDDFVELLEPGQRRRHAVVQNGATGAVGRAVTQIAAARGIPSVSLLRRHGGCHSTGQLDDGDGSTLPIDDEARRQELLRLGASVALFEDELRDRRDEVQSLGVQFSLGLNCIGGESAAAVAKLLSPSAHLVTYGGMSKQPVAVPTGLFIFKELKCHGFWMTRWMNDIAKPADKMAMLNELAGLARNGAIHTDVECFPLETEWRRGIEQALAPYRAKKPVLLCNVPSRDVS